ncbi:hypothetical protein QE152_g19413 [Popillia japonica]|uniref:Uncharacterized protein n=1 Tax=Popillia japonica TaxID=7064 RepID=A0AAW1KRL3_POPJA
MAAFRKIPTPTGGRRFRGAPIIPGSRMPPTMLLAGAGYARYRETGQGGTMSVQYNSGRATSLLEDSHITLQTNEDDVAGAPGDITISSPKWPNTPAGRGGQPKSSHTSRMPPTMLLAGAGYARYRETGQGGTMSVQYNSGRATSLLEDSHITLQTNEDDVAGAPG